MKRSTPLQRLTSRPHPRTGKKRKASETLRVYGPPERRAWIRSLACVYCGLRGQSVNAHTENGGMGRKADYSTIVPLCTPHHRRFDQHIPPFDGKLTRQFVKDMAPIIEARWQAKTSPNPEHISGPLGRVLEQLFEESGDDAS